MEVGRIRSAYGTDKEFLQVFHPGNTSRYLELYQDNCIVGTAPSLYLVAQTYGMNILVAILKLHLEKCLRSEGVDPDKLSSVEEVEQAAIAIATKYKDIKISELFLFFGHYHDEYDEHHGKVSKIRQSLRLYYNSRSELISAIEKRIKNEKRIIDEKSRKGKTMNYLEWEQYKKEHPELVTSKK